MTSKVEFMLFYGQHNVRYGPRGVDLSDFKCKKKGMDRPTERRFGSVYKALQIGFRINEETHLMTIQAVVNWAEQGERWELMLITSTQDWNMYMQAALERGWPPALLIRSHLRSAVAAGGAEAEDEATVEGPPAKRQAPTDPATLSSATASPIRDASRIGSILPSVDAAQAHEQTADETAPSSGIQIEAKTRIPSPLPQTDVAAEARAPTPPSPTALNLGPADSTAPSIPVPSSRRIESSSDYSSSTELDEAPTAAAATTAPPEILASMFDFDISQYWTNEVESSEQQQSLSAEEQNRLATLIPFLDRSTDEILSDVGPIKALFHQLAQRLPDDLAEALNAAAHIDSYQLRVSKAQARLSARKEQLKASDAFNIEKAKVIAQKQQLDALNAKPFELPGQIDQLKREAAELEAALEAKRREIQAKQEELNRLSESIDQQEAVLKSAILQVARMTKSLKPIPGTAEDDIAIINEADFVRIRALDCLRKYLN